MTNFAAGAAGAATPTDADADADADAEQPVGGILQRQDPLTPGLADIGLHSRRAPGFMVVE